MNAPAEISPLDLALAAEVEILDVRQGSPEWLEFRRTRFGASEAAAMLGLSKMETRAELLHRYHTGLQVEHSDYVQERVLDRGHAVEAAIRGFVEESIGDDLSPVTCARRGTRLAASCDGLTLMRETAWECKQWNDELAEQVFNGVVPDTHMPQCQQVLLVTGAGRLIFTVTDGTPQHTLSVPVRPDRAWFDRIVRGWLQFEADLQAYVPPPAAPVAIASAVVALPTPSVRLDGAIVVRDNLPDFARQLQAFIARVPASPSTDQEFADAERACKVLEQAEGALDQAESAALASIPTVEALRRVLVTLRESARRCRLVTEKVVARRKDELRAQAIEDGVRALSDHIEGLRPKHRGFLVFAKSAAAQELGAAIKGLRSLDSVRAAVNARAAALKTAASASADRIDVNVRTIEAAGEKDQGLFADRHDLASKDPEAVAAIVSQRVAAQRAREAAAAPAPAPAAPAAPAAAPAPAASAAPAAAAAAPTLRLADISARLGWTLKAAEIHALGIETRRDGAAVLVNAADLPRLKAALIEKVEAL